MNPFVWLWRIRHRRGYGIHSPFAFSIVKGVIYERGTYLPYAPLTLLRKQRNIKTSERDDRLLLRLANEHQPCSALLLTSPDDIATEYLKAGCKTCQYEVCQNVGSAKQEEYDLVYIAPIGNLHLESILPLLSQRALLICRDIRYNKETLNNWKVCASNTKLRLSFDLYHIGLAYTETRLNKEHHIINYP